LGGGGGGGKNVTHFKELGFLGENGVIKRWSKAQGQQQQQMKKKRKE